MTKDERIKPHLILINVMCIDSLSSDTHTRYAILFLPTQLFSKMIKIEMAILHARVKFHKSFGNPTLLTDAQITVEY